MDQTIRNLVIDYLKQHDIEPRREDIDLEKFGNYCVFYSRQTYDKFNIDNVHVGGNKDTGLDGIGILVGGDLIDAETEDDIDQKFDKENRLDVKFIFTQVKNENEFKRKDILDTFYAVRDFFSKNPTRQRNLQVKKKAKLALHLLDKYKLKIRDKPICTIYFITNARNLPSPAIQKLIKQQECELKNQCEYSFKKVELFPWGCDDLERVYRTTRLQVETTVLSTTALIDLVGKKENTVVIQGVKKAFIGNFRFSEFKKIIMDEEENIRPFIFYDNIRGFLGNDNAVNHQIKATLESENRNRFAILNNGVTIIASEVLDQSQHEIRITDYQIVNGCQTSYVLYNWYKEQYKQKHIDLDAIIIPVKIIETSDSEVRNAIIKATNSQTEVQKELLLALSEFPKKLEDFYKYQNSQHNLYYERRPGQYNNDSNIKNKLIIKIGDQIKTFAAMFLDLPHQVRYKQSLIDKIPSEIFLEKHKPIPYYTSSLASYRLEELVRQDFLPFENSKHIHYHILTVFKYMVGGSECPSCTSPKIENYCKNIIKVLEDDKNCLHYFMEAKKLVIQKAVEYNSNSQIDYANFFKSKDFTESLIQELKVSNKNVNLVKYTAQDYTTPTKKKKASSRKKKEDTPPLFRLLPEQDLSSKEHLSDNNRIPEFLNQKQLAQRLDIDRSTISRKRLIPDFAEWTSKNDPDEIAWRYDKDTTYYYPLN
ncbi:MAG: AIPR family protein [Coleofasciculaceae cyanobacterium]